MLGSVINSTADLLRLGQGTAAAFDAQNGWDELTNIVELGNGYPIAFHALSYNNAGRVQWEFKGPLPHSNSIPERTMQFDADNRLASFNRAGVAMASGMWSNAANLKRNWK